MTAETETGEALSGAGMPRPPDTERDEARLPLELPRGRVPETPGGFGAGHHLDGVGVCEAPVAPR